MERLNLRTPKPYDYSDQAGQTPARMRFYCILEGPTEEAYFFGVKNHKEKLGIKNDVYIEIIDKQEGQETYSHPMQLVKACLSLMGHIDEHENPIKEAEWDKHCKWKDFDADIDRVN